MRLIGQTNLDLLEQMFDQLPHNPFFVKDHALRYVAANGAMARLCGAARPSDLYGKTALDLFPGALGRRYETLDQQVLASGQAITNKLELSTGRAETVWLLYSRLPVKAADGKTIGVTGVSRELKAPGGRDLLYNRLAKVAERLRSQSDHPLRLDQLATLAATSKSQLARDFTRVFAMTPGGFLQQLRLDRALRLLETDKSIAQVAHECGYVDQSAFARRFRKSIGVSPQHYRTRIRVTHSVPR
ncbi:AraC family transcriptional regulator [Sphingomonas panacisoli]|uniref:AraC family transcriptional regulator n=1 Tax=Sphingomonas panacisoli TaxID=1813879 RepID=A0A5B8LEM8_9SPHN|nr:AraC family transcriptional regulator [Sphingomonas panacisoli]QDZ06406.1 AraC family transcriptional regulator [Sphingomonas panacisoli]